MARGRDFTALDGFKDGTALLFGMRAVKVFALAVMLAELAHSVGEVVEGEEVEVFEVYHRKTGRVGKESAPLKRKELRLARGVLSARDLSADLARRKLHFGEEDVNKGRFSNTRCARKSGNLALQAFFNIGRKLRNALALVARKTECGVECGFVGLLKLFGNLAVKLAFADDHHSLDPVIFGNRKELEYLIGELEILGYQSLDLNMGCPFPLQARHGRGSGILAHTDIVAEIMAVIKNYSHLNFSVKMRLGWANSNEWEPILKMLNEVPLTHIALHPRTGIQQYKGVIDYNAFSHFYEMCHHPIIYNGDITSLPQLQEMQDRFPRLAALMLGRGLLARPSLAKEYLEGREWSREEQIGTLCMLHAKLMEQYANIVKGDAQLHGKLRSFWEYTEPLIGHKACKKIMKSGNLRNYLKAIEELR